MWRRHTRPTTLFIIFSSFLRYLADWWKHKWINRNCWPKLRNLRVFFLKNWKRTFTCKTFFRTKVKINCNISPHFQYIMSIILKVIIVVQIGRSVCIEHKPKKGNFFFFQMNCIVIRITDYSTVIDNKVQHWSHIVHIPFEKCVNTFEVVC